MELREIATFLQVAQLKSFSKAAKQLGYSQAAVTIQVKQLEKELNVHLFDPHWQTDHLNPPGRRVL